MRDRRVDGINLAATQPGIVVEVRIALPPGGAGAMALDTVDAEGGSAAGGGELRQLRIGEDFLERDLGDLLHDAALRDPCAFHVRSEEHTSELQSLMRIPTAFFCLKKKTTTYKLATNIYYIGT